MNPILTIYYEYTFNDSFGSNRITNLPWKHRTFQKIRRSEIKTLPCIISDLQSIQKAILKLINQIENLREQKSSITLNYFEEMFIINLLKLDE